RARSGRLTQRSDHHRRVVKPLASPARAAGARNIQAPASAAHSATLFVLVALTAFAAWRVAARAWLCDDSFIVLRYAQNLLHGQGLVYNPGERVEGYTDLLWVLMVAGSGALGVRLETAAIALGEVSYAALVLMLVARWWMRRDEGAAIPVAAG